MISIAQLSDDPRYNIKTVCAETGIKAVTLRAWERRYHLLTPRRSEKLYRRYSEREIGMLCWIKNRVNEGVAIRNVIDEWNASIRKGNWPEVAPLFQSPEPDPLSVQPLNYVEALVQAFACHDENQAQQIFKAARLSVDLETLCLKIIVPTMNALEEGWRTDGRSIACERFASTFVRFQLGHIFQTIPIQQSQPQILCACAPGELHEFDILMASILLRQDGYPVEYLGQDVPVPALVDRARTMRPALILISAAQEPSARRILDLQRQLSQLHPTPLLGFGGQAFQINPFLRATISGVFLGETADLWRKKVHELIQPGADPVSDDNRS